MAILDELMRQAAGVESRRNLVRAGMSDHQIGRAVGDGTIRRIRKGWYALPGAHEETVRAVRAGGALTCISALKLLGVWTMPDNRVHVRVARGVDVDRRPDVVVHWSNLRQRQQRPVVDVAEAVACMVSCLDRRDAVVALDSAMNRGVIRVEEALQICERTPRGRAVARLLDPQSESGLETLVRLALRRWRIRVRSQVAIPQVGRVDLLIGERLVVELDGAAWHDRAGDFENDRRRDRLLAVRDYMVIRASYRQVIYEWPEIEAQILQLVRRNLHRRRRRVGKSDRIRARPK